MIIIPEDTTIDHAVDPQLLVLQDMAENRDLVNVEEHGLKRVDLPYRGSLSLSLE
jgi:hypothetical protein